MRLEGFEKGNEHCTYMMRTVLIWKCTFVSKLANVAWSKSQQKLEMECIPFAFSVKGLLHYCCDLTLVFIFMMPLEATLLCCQHQLEIYLVMLPLEYQYL